MFEKYDVNLIYYTEKKINTKGEEKNNRVCMDYKYQDYQKQCQKNRTGRKKPMENRKSGL